MPKVMLAKLVKKEQLKDNIFKFSLETPEIASIARPGQFIEIKVSDKNMDPFLRRPISIHNVDKENGILEIIFRVQGNGTDILSKKQEGELIDIIGPLGYGTFKYEGYKNIAILGGGIGSFPLYELAKNARQNANVYTYLGFRDKEAVVLEKEFRNVSNELVITTSDGSYGIHGFATNNLEEDLDKKNIDCIFACGPFPMLKSIQTLAKEKNVPCQISLEERMGCGFGVCVGCAVKKAGSSEHIHVCKQGPVFGAQEVEL